MTPLQTLSFDLFFLNPTPTAETYTLSLHDALPISVVRHPEAPADEGAHEHGDAAADPHQVADAEQRKGELEIEAGDRRPWVRTEAEAVSYVPQEQPRLHHHQEQGGDQRTHQHSFQALAAGFHRILVRNVAGADLDDLGAGGALGIGQIRVRYQRAAQGDGIHDSEDAACGADGYRLPIGKAAPPPDHDEAGQHEDDGGERAGGGSHRLHDVVLLGGGVAEPAQQRHGEDYRRDGGGESEPSLQPEVDVGGSENHGEHHAQDKSAQRQLGARFGLHAAQHQLGARFRLHRLDPQVLVLYPALQERAPSASSSTVVSGLRKKDSSGMRHALTPWRSSAPATTGPTAATRVCPSAAHTVAAGATANSRSTWGVLVKAIASTSPALRRAMSPCTAASSAASAYT